MYQFVEIYTYLICSYSLWLIFGTFIVLFRAKATKYTQMDNNKQFFFIKTHPVLKNSHSDLKCRLLCFLLLTLSSLSYCSFLFIRQFYDPLVNYPFSLCEGSYVFLKLHLFKSFVTNITNKWFSLV